MSTKKHRLDDVPAYRRWVKARDRALEELHTNAQLRSADVLRQVLSAVLQADRGYYAPAKASPAYSTDHFDHHVKSIFVNGVHELYRILIQMKVNAYVLAKASEAEILAQCLRTRKVYAKVSHQDLEKIRNKKSLAGGNIFHRTALYMDRLRRKIINQAQGSVLNAKDEQAFLIDVLQSFPRKRKVKRPKRLLKPKLMEAKGDPKTDMSVDVIDKDSWDKMVDDYKADVVPKYRGPEYVVDLGGDDEDQWYAWEFERDLMNEFVSSVRDGQIDAANDNGISEFVWIAVVDNVTDACCLWRDGLLTSEIEEQLDDHEGDDEECDAEGSGLTPPLHFNCRCTLSPATDDVPDKPDDGSKDFDDWLNS